MAESAADSKQAEGQSSGHQQHASRGVDAGATGQAKVQQGQHARDQGAVATPKQASATLLNMLADACKQQQDDTSGVTSTKRSAGGDTAAEDTSRPAKVARRSPADSPQAQETQGAEPFGMITYDDDNAAAAAVVPPVSPADSGAADAANQRGLSPAATAAELQGSLAAFTAAAAATAQANAAAAAAAGEGSPAADAQLLLGGLNRVGSGMANVPLGSGGPLQASQGKSSPREIMESLVAMGLLQSYSPETHCYVQCGRVQGVFCLASGSILCLCNQCSASSTCWYSPSAWERHGGMAASKKWRGSIQVKGLSSRRTLGQWLDERGVPAKPRLTLADQVQQHTVGCGVRSLRGGAPTSAGAAAAAAGLAAAWGNGDLPIAAPVPVPAAVGMGGGSGTPGSQRRASAHDSRHHSTAGGAEAPLTRGISEGEGELLEALQHATGPPAGLQRSISHTAQLVATLDMLDPAEAAAQARSMQRFSLGSSQLEQLLDQAGVPKGGGSFAAPSSAGFAGSGTYGDAMLAAAVATSQALQQLGMLPAATQMQQLPQLQPAALQPPMADMAAAVASADAAQEAATLIMQLLPALPPEKAAAAAALLAAHHQQQQQQLSPRVQQSHGNSHAQGEAHADAAAAAAVAAAAAAAATAAAAGPVPRSPLSPRAPLMVIHQKPPARTSHQGQPKPKGSAVAPSAAAGSPHMPAALSPSGQHAHGASAMPTPLSLDAPSDAAAPAAAAPAPSSESKRAPQRSLKDVLLLATTTAARNPSLASSMLLQALQQQLALQDAACRQAAAGAAAAVASAGDMFAAATGVPPGSKQRSAAAAFAAIAAAAAAAAAAVAGLEEQEEQLQLQEAKAPRQQDTAKADKVAAQQHHHHQHQQQQPQVSLAMAPPRMASGVPATHPAAGAHDSKHMHSIATTAPEAAAAGPGSSGAAAQPAGTGTEALLAMLGAASNAAAPGGPASCAAAAAAAPAKFDLSTLLPRIMDRQQQQQQQAAHQHQQIDTMNLLANLLKAAQKQRL